MKNSYFQVLAVVGLIILFIASAYWQYLKARAVIIINSQQVEQ